MEVSIIGNQNGCVHVRSSFGTFLGIWCSPRPPELRRYLVELDSNDFVFPNAVLLSSQKQPNIQRQNGTTNVTGIFEGVDEGLLFLRIGTDLLMLETVQDYDYSKYIGQYVQIALSELLLYDLGLL